MLIKLLFGFSIFIIAYVYVGYALLLYFLAIFTSKSSKKSQITDEQLPEITLFIAAWNEKDVVREKVQNSFDLDYPKEKLTLLWVTDGSTDGTPELLQTYSQITVLHELQRNGKIGAMNRGMSYVKTPIVVFCDANTFLNSGALREIVATFDDETVGCVAGEKRIISFEKDSASGSGEGFYWKIESLIKQKESQLGSTVGAAGELFAIRTELFEIVESDTILDDFLISMRIAAKGYKVKYNAKAVASEYSSASVSDEIKRKIRIAAGGFQVVSRLKGFFNPCKHPWLTVTFISHKVLRWTLLPIAFLLACVTNILLVLHQPPWYFKALLMLQIIFYLASSVGYLLQNTSIKIKLFFLPYYLMVMNYAIVMGFIRFLKKKQNVNWDRAARAQKQ